MIKKILLALTLTAIAPTVALADSPSNPPASEVGSLLAGEMCKDLKTNGELVSDNAFERISGLLLREYGPQAGLFFLDLAMLFSKSGDVIANDPYAFEMFQSVFQGVLDDEDCFRAFLANEVFGEDGAVDDEDLADPGSMPDQPM